MSEWPILCEVTNETPLLDASAFALMPEEFRMQFLPVEVAADGNCFCRALSLLATGTEEHHTEIRVRSLSTDLYVCLPGSIKFRIHDPSRTATLSYRYRRAAVIVRSVT